MAYDEGLAERIREILAAETGLSERKMFGGLAFMLDGHMCCGIVGDEMMIRNGAQRADAALDPPHVRPMDFTGRPMRGMVYVAPAGLRGAALRRWLDQAIAHARSLPPKQPKRRR